MTTINTNATNAANYDSSIADRSGRFSPLIDKAHSKTEEAMKEVADSSGNNATALAKYSANHFDEMALVKLQGTDASETFKTWDAIIANIRT